MACFFITINNMHITAPSHPKKAATQNGIVEFIKYRYVKKGPKIFPTVSALVPHAKICAALPFCANRDKYVFDTFVDKPLPSASKTWVIKM